MTHLLALAGHLSASTPAPTKSVLRQQMTCMSFRTRSRLLLRRDRPFRGLLIVELSKKAYTYRSLAPSLFFLAISPIMNEYVILNGEMQHI